MLSLTPISRILLQGCAILALTSPLLAVHAGKIKLGWEASNSTRSFTAIALANDTTINPMRGFYRWQNQELVPQSAPALDSYRRYYWRDLETAEGQYNFTSIVNDLQTARSQGRKFAFRLRMMSGYDDDVLYAPAYLVNNPLCQQGCGFWADTDAADPGLTFIPDWNDPYLMQRSRALLQALAQTIGADNDAIAWIDVGMYGQYGEWAMKSAAYTSPPAGITPVTDANKREYAKMHFDVFPRQQHVMFIPYSNKDALSYGLFQQTITTKPVGLRVDCLSRFGYFDQWTNRPTEWDLFKNQWQKAPFVAEFCPFKSGDTQNNAATAREQAATFHISNVGNGNFATNLPDADRWNSFTPTEKADILALGRELGYRYSVDNATVAVTTAGQLTVTTTVRSLGNAPTYEPWTVQIELVNSSGVVKWSGPLTLNLSNLLGAGVTQSVQGSWTLPTLSADLYSVRLAARDKRSNPRAALKWVVSERSADGTLVIGSVRRR